MQDILLKKFHGHLKEQHPDLVLQLQDEGRLRLYLHEAVLPFESLSRELLDAGTSPGYAEEQCFTQWRQGLPPSKYHFLKEMLQEEFSGEYLTLQENGLLTTELLNLITYCDPVFEALGFDEEDHYLRYLLIGTVHDYFETVRKAKEA